MIRHTLTLSLAWTLVASSSPSRAGHLPPCRQEGENLVAFEYYDATFKCRSRRIIGPIRFSKAAPDGKSLITSFTVTNGVYEGRSYYKTSGTSNSTLVSPEETEIFYKAGRFHGSFSRKDPRSGQIRELSNWLDGKRDGETLAADPSAPGGLAKSVYENGKLISSTKPPIKTKPRKKRAFSLVSKELVLPCTTRHGRHEAKIKFLSQKRFAEFSCRDGEPNGPFRVFEDYYLMLEGTFAAGELEGPARLFSSGSAWEEGAFSKGKADGPFRRYSDGVLVEESLFRSGVEIDPPQDLRRDAAEKNSRSSKILRHYASLCDQEGGFTCVSACLATFEMDDTYVSTRSEVCDRGCEKGEKLACKLKQCYVPNGSCPLSERSFDVKRCETDVSAVLCETTLVKGLSVVHGSPSFQLELVAANLCKAGRTYYCPIAKLTKPSNATLSEACDVGIWAGCLRLLEEDQGRQGKGNAETRAKIAERACRLAPGLCPHVLRFIKDDPVRRELIRMSCSLSSESATAETACAAKLEKSLSDRHQH